jgi:hypothetical protein
MTSINTPEQISAYQCLVIASALKLYAKTGMKAARAYTPANMIRAAEAMTGQKFRARDYMGAANALRALAGSEPYTD